MSKDYTIGELHATCHTAAQDARGFRGTITSDRLVVAGDRLVDQAATISELSMMLADVTRERDAEKHRARLAFDGLIAADWADDLRPDEIKAFFEIASWITRKGVDLSVLLDRLRAAAEQATEQQECADDHAFRMGLGLDASAECNLCGAPVSITGIGWRWDGESWAHKCPGSDPGSDPQVGHVGRAVPRKLAAWSDGDKVLHRTKDGRDRSRCRHCGASGTAPGWHHSELDSGAVVWRHDCRSLREFLADPGADPGTDPAPNPSERLPGRSVHDWENALDGRFLSALACNLCGASVAGDGWSFGGGFWMHACADGRHGRPVEVPKAPEPGDPCREVPARDDGDIDTGSILQHSAIGDGYVVVGGHQGAWIAVRQLTVSNPGEWLTVKSPGSASVADLMPIVYALSTGEDPDYASGPIWTALRLLAPDLYTECGDLGDADAALDEWMAAHEEVAVATGFRDPSVTPDEEASDRSTRRWIASHREGHSLGRQGDLDGRRSQVHEFPEESPGEVPLGEAPHSIPDGSRDDRLETRSAAYMVPKLD